jgi:hypothetical protein
MTRARVCHWLAPKAIEPCSNGAGTACKASSAIEYTNGTIASPRAMPTTTAFNGESALVGPAPSAWINGASSTGASHHPSRAAGGNSARSTWVSRPATRVDAAGIRSRTSELIPASTGNAAQNTSSSIRCRANCGASQSAASNPNTTVGTASSSSIAGFIQLRALLRPRRAV